MTLKTTTVGIWTLGGTVLGAIVLIGAAWTAIGTLPSPGFSTDVEVGVAVAAEAKIRGAADYGIGKRIDDTVDPQIIELAGAVSAIQKGLDQNRLLSLRAAIATADSDLYAVRERLKKDAANPDAIARERQLRRTIDSLNADERRTCAQLKSADPSFRC